jgi:hypothetical protein
MQFYETPNQRQAYSGAAVTTLPRFISFVKMVKDVWQVSRVYSTARISH